MVSMNVETNYIYLQMEITGMRDGGCTADTCQSCKNTGGFNGLTMAQLH